MNIKFDIAGEEYTLSSDELQYIVGKLVVREDKDGKMTERWVQPSFFATLEGVFTHLLNLKVKKANITSLEELRDSMDTFRAELSGIFARKPISGPAGGRTAAFGG